MPYPQNQVTVRSSETGDVYQISRGFAERHLDTLTILDDAEAVAAMEQQPGYHGLFDEPAPDVAADGDASVQSVDKQADPIAAPVADDK